MTVTPIQRWLVVASRFNEAVVERLVDGALDELARAGFGDEAVRVARVAGAFEVPQLVARACGLSGQPSTLPRGVVALAAIVRGETPHFDHVCAETTRALMDCALRSGVPIGFGVLTCDDMAQAMARAGGEAGNKGREAAAAVLDLATAATALDATPGDEALDASRTPGAARGARSGDGPWD